MRIIRLKICPSNMTGVLIKRMIQSTLLDTRNDTNIDGASVNADREQKHRQDNR